jgi:hypothetical protein
MVKCTGQTVYVPISPGLLGCVVNALSDFRRIVFATSASVISLHSHCRVYCFYKHRLQYEGCYTTLLKTKRSSECLVKDPSLSSSAAAAALTTNTRARTTILAGRRKHDSRTSCFLCSLLSIKLNVDANRERNPKISHQTRRTVYGEVVLVTRTAVTCQTDGMQLDTRTRPMSLYLFLFRFVFAHTTKTAKRPTRAKSTRSAVFLNVTRFLSRAGSPHCYRLQVNQQERAGLVHHPTAMGGILSPWDYCVAIAMNSYLSGTFICTGLHAGMQLKRV